MTATTFSGEPSPAVTKSSGRGDAAGLVLGVQGLAGGVGTSCLAAALAGRAAAAGRQALAVDACPWGAGLDLLLGLDCETGLRWPDLASLEGDPDTGALLAALPGEPGLAVLSWSRAPQRPGPGRPWCLVPHLARAVDVVVCDLPALGSPEGGAWWSACDRVVVVSRDGLDAFAAAGAAAELVPRVAGLVVRTGTKGGIDAESVAIGLGLPLLATVGSDSGVATALARGEPVGRARALQRCADRVLAEVLVATTGSEG